MKIKNFFNSYGIPLLTLLFISCSNKTGQMPQNQQQTYKTISITSCDKTLTNSYSASIRGKQDIDIYPQISGTLKEVCVKEGEHVKKGQRLFVVEQNTYKATLNQSIANVESAEASLASSELTYESKENLFKENVISEYELLTAKNTLANAKASLAQAKAQEASARTNYDYTIITSPANGVVGNLPYFQGALINPSLSEPLTTISDNSEMYIYFSVNEKQLLSLTREYGSTDEALKQLPDVTLQLSDGTEYAEKGRIESISGVIDRTTGSTSLRAIFPNSNGLLHSGFSGNVLLPSVYKDCIVIPQSATTEIQDKVIAYKVIDGKAQSTQIKVSQLNDGDEYVVTDGLKKGDIIIANGAGLLKDGMEVKTK